MVQGIEVDLFRPDDELRALAHVAVEHGQDSPEFAAAFETAKDPWFNFSSGNGFYSDDRVWLDHPDIPLGFIQGYVEKLRAGERIERPTADVAAERDRITGEYRALLADDEIRAAFDEKLGLSRLVFPYVENHNFYVEHWALSVFWRRIRELGAVLAGAGFWAQADDIFYVRRDELVQVIYDYGSGWAVGADAAGPSYWPAEIARRKAIIAALEAKSPAPALNQPPEVVTEPFTIMLYGITTDRVSQWLSGTGDASELSGMAASPGVAEGVARVVSGPDDLASLLPGEVLVARITAPSWGPVFGRIAATVTDIGGMMSHAAIVCREYGLPAVTGTGAATASIKTGQRVRVDGSNGTVTILD
jgi:pyruvate,water dikinase